jgi:hypothetical protein
MNIVPSFAIHVDEAKPLDPTPSKGEPTPPNLDVPNAANSPTPEFRDFLPSDPGPRELEPQESSSAAAVPSAGKMQPPHVGSPAVLAGIRAIEAAITGPTSLPLARVLPRATHQPMPVDFRFAAPTLPRARRGPSGPEPSPSTDDVTVKPEKREAISAWSTIGSPQALVAAGVAPRLTTANKAEKDGVFSHTPAFAPQSPPDGVESTTNPTAPSISTTDTVGIASLGDDGARTAINVATPPRLQSASATGVSASAPTPTRAQRAQSPEPQPNASRSTESRVTAGNSPPQKPEFAAPVIPKDPGATPARTAEGPAPLPDLPVARSRSLEPTEARRDLANPASGDVTRAAGKFSPKTRATAPTETSTILPTQEASAASRTVTTPTHLASPALAAGDNALTAVSRMSVDDVSARTAQDDLVPATVLSAANQLVMRRAAHGEMDHPELGRVDVSAHLRDGQLDVRIVAQRAETATILAPHARAIAADIHTADAPTARVDIQSRGGAATSHHSGGSHHSAASGSGSHSSNAEQPTRPHDSDSDSESDSVTPAPRRVRIVL